MKCPICSGVCPDDARYCPNCGAITETFPNRPSPVPPEQNNSFSYVSGPVKTVETGFRAKLLKSVKSPLFLTLMILASTGFGISLVFGNPQILGLLFVIFGWLVFAKGRRDTLDTKNLKHISGVVFTEYVIGWIYVGLLALFGVLFGALANTSALSEVFEKVSFYISSNTNISEDVYEIIETFEQYGTPVIFTILSVVMLIFAVSVALFNVFGIRSIHKFVQSSYKGAEINRNITVKFAAAKGWILAFGIIEGITTLMNVFSNGGASFIVSGITSAEYIIGYLLVTRTFSEE